MAKPTILYFYRGQVERHSLQSNRNPWRDGYSAKSETGGTLYPWMTKRECQADAKALGCRAVFVEER